MEILKVKLNEIMMWQFDDYLKFSRVTNQQANQPISQ